MAAVDVVCPDKTSAGLELAMTKSRVFGTVVGVIAASLISLLGLPPPDLHHVGSVGSHVRDDAEVVEEALLDLRELHDASDHLSIPQPAIHLNSHSAAHLHNCWCGGGGRFGGSDQPVRPHQDGRRLPRRNVSG